MIRKGIYVALVLLVAGIAGFIYTLRLTGINELYTVKHEQTAPNEPIRTVQIHSPQTDVYVLPSEQNTVTADVRVSKKSREQLYRIDITGSGGKLQIDVIRKDPYRDNIGMLFYRERVEVRLPHKLYDKVEVTSKRADVKLEGISSKSMVVHTSGDIRVNGKEVR
ncbi:DUF4097 family beta strand repeat-containing protein [Paenibacillus cellulositrophicus]|uniref:DUF4097 family beta strand repeat-containing protein n=1 Tax=Paenibacillus cellulositrophicus TaxID=562959 RepID=UPI001267467E|nr:DUF4097 family beta strand repeat-containing protein [Paenibacillus cellulositrophicus]